MGKQKVRTNNGGGNNRLMNMFTKGSGGRVCARGDAMGNCALSKLKCIHMKPKSSGIFKCNKKA